MNKIFSKLVLLRPLTLSLFFITINVAEAKKFKVVATFTVLADMASNVAGDAATVISITKPGAEIHGYQPTPGDLVKASDADLILLNGMNLELRFKQFLSNIGRVPSVILTKSINLFPLLRDLIRVSQIHMLGWDWIVL